MTSPHSISDLLNEQNLLSGEVLVEYEGRFSLEVNDNLIECVDQAFPAEMYEAKIRKKVFNISVEIIQNLFHYSSKSALPENYASMLFMISDRSDQLEIVTTNTITKSHAKGISARLTMVNSFSKEELRLLYRGVLDQGDISDQGGAGLGFIDIARKSNQQLNHYFIDIDDQYCFFVLKINVSK